MADGSLICRLEGYPDEGFHVDFSCPASASTLSDCSTCNVISDESAEQCSSCTICSDTVAYDCSNIAEGECVILECSGKCAQQPTTPTPTNPKPTTPTTPTTMPPGPSYCGGICIPENELCVYEVCCCNQKGCDYMYDPFTGQSWALCM
jgi:hypothetical protein